MTYQKSNKDSSPHTDTIPKRVAAIEVTRHLQHEKTTNLGTIILIIISALTIIFNQTIGTGILLLSIIYYGYSYKRNEAEINRLKETYEI